MEAILGFSVKKQIFAVMSFLQFFSLLLSDEMATSKTTTENGLFFVYSYQSPYFPNGYRGSTGAGGYASLTIPGKSLANVLTPNYANNSYGKVRFPPSQPRRG